MQKEHYDFTDLLNFFTKIWSWVFLVFIGLVGKFGLYLQSGQKYNGWKLLGSTLIAAFVGYLASIYCIEHYPCDNGFNHQAAFIVPIATLMSDRLMLLIISVNWTNVIQLVIKKNKKE